MTFRFKEIMEEKGISNVKLAEAVGISKVAISNIVTGKQKPSLDTIVAIARALGVKVDDIIVADEAQDAKREKVSSCVLPVFCPCCGHELSLKVGVSLMDQPGNNDINPQIEQ